MKDNRFEDLDEQIRDAASFALIAGNPAGHIEQALRLLNIAHRRTIVQSVYSAYSLAGAARGDLDEFVAARVFNNDDEEEKRFSEERAARVGRVISGADARGVASVIASCLLEQEGAELGIEEIVRALLLKTVTLPEQGASLVAATKFCESQVARMEHLPGELEREFRLLPRSAPDRDDDALEATNEDEPAWFRIYQHSETLAERRELEGAARRRDPFLAAMVRDFDLRPSVNPSPHVLRQNLDMLSDFVTKYVNVARSVVDSRSIVPAARLVEYLGLAGAPSPLIVPTWAIAVCRASLKEAIRQVQKSCESLLQMTPGQFEDFVGSLFRALGYRVEQTARTRDGGADLLCLRHDAGIPFRIAVELKRYRDTKIDVSMVRSFVGANQQFQADRLIFVTTSSYTRPAMQFADTYARRLLLLRDYDQIREWCREAWLSQGW